MGGAGKAATKKEMAQVRVIAMEDVEKKVFPSDILEGVAQRRGGQPDKGGEQIHGNERATEGTQIFSFGIGGCFVKVEGSNEGCGTSIWTSGCGLVEQKDLADVASEGCVHGEMGPNVVVAASRVDDAVLRVSRARMPGALFGRSGKRGEMVDPLDLCEDRVDDLWRQAEQRHRT